MPQLVRGVVVGFCFLLFAVTTKIDPHRESKEAGRMDESAPTKWCPHGLFCGECTIVLTEHVEENFSFDTVLLVCEMLQRAFARISHLCV